MYHNESNCSSKQRSGIQCCTAMPKQGTGKHPCVLCNAVLDSKEELQDHFRKHANKEIDAKGRSKHSNGEPEKVTRVVSIPKTEGPTTSSVSKSDTGVISCDVCTVEFETVTAAIQHKFKKHPDSAIKHFCGYCGKQFPLKISRDMHLPTHSEKESQGSFPCQECGVVFHNPAAQSYHFKSTHKRIVAFFQPVATPPPSKKIKMNNAGEAQSVYYCHLCGFEYIVKFNLQKHLEKQHPETERSAVPQEMIRCTTCDALFYNKRAYENHNMYHKPDDLYVTSEQQRLQTVTRVDQDFDIRRVQTPGEKYVPVSRGRRAKQKPEKKPKTSHEDIFDFSSSSSCSDSDDDNGEDSKKWHAKRKHRSSLSDSHEESCEDPLCIGDKCENVTAHRKWSDPNTFLTNGNSTK